MPDRVADHLNNRIFFRLFQVANVLQRQAVKELGVTTVQWAVLGALSDPRPTYGMAVGTLVSDRRTGQPDRQTFAVGPCRSRTLSL